eukprot:6195832-Pleurochrysis_carterae.AAC.1
MGGEEGRRWMEQRGGRGEELSRREQRRGGHARIMRWRRVGERACRATEGGGVKGGVRACGFARACCERAPAGIAPPPPTAAACARASAARTCSRRRRARPAERQSARSPGSETAPARATTSRARRRTWERVRARAACARLRACVCMRACACVRACVLRTSNCPRSRRVQHGVRVRAPSTPPLIVPLPILRPPEILRPEASTARRGARDGLGKGHDARPRAPFLRR